MVRLVVFCWGVGGVLLLLLRAVVRMLPWAWEPISTGMLTPSLWAAWVLLVGGMCISEGYHGFQLKFSPRVAVRAMHLCDNPTPLYVVLAPPFCMGLVGATRKRLITSWGVVAAIVAAVLFVRWLDQPWRGIVDAGVVAGLVWGVVATAAWAVVVWNGHMPDIPADVPK